MGNVSERNPSRAQKWGWVLLLAVSALLLLNGVGWFVVGPSLSTFEQDTGVPLEEFRRTYPSVADSIATNARQVAIWFVAFGLQALFVALHGFRHHSQWAWNAAWVLVAAPAAIGVNVVIGEQLGFGAGMLGVAALALLGQWLTRKGLVT